MMDVIEAASRLGEILVSTLAVPEAAVVDALEAQASGDPRNLGQILEEAGQLESEDLATAIELQRRMRLDDLPGALSDIVAIAYDRARRTIAPSLPPMPKEG